MAKNKTFGPEKTRVLPVLNGTLSGSPVISTNTVGVAVTDEGGGVGAVEGFATVDCTGQFRLPVSTNTALAIDAPVYIIAATYVLTPASSGNVLFGYARSAKGTAPATIEVEIHQV